MGLSILFTKNGHWQVIIVSHWTNWPEPNPHFGQSTQGHPLTLSHLGCYVIQPYIIFILIN